MKRVVVTVDPRVRLREVSRACARRPGDAQLVLLVGERTLELGPDWDVEATEECAQSFGRLFGLDGDPGAGRLVDV